MKTVSERKPSRLLYQVNLVPAYGQDYRKPVEVLQAWNKGTDFRIADIGNRWDGCYTSIRDWADKSVRIRFNRLEDFVIIYNHSIVGSDDDKIT